MSVKVKKVVAYVLMRVEHGANEEVLEDLGQIEEVTESSRVFGEFDIHCKVEADDIDKLAEVVGKIRELKVITTETLVTHKRRIKRLSNRRHKEIRRTRTPRD
ncbi:MAG: Lrp/AsnC ligand binding domain-containing protein [Candidatus Bathyarchaeota archaeon]|nr:MAG: Lrp/AsnC ligand binding domain-containing protein [Candidatus Bathyarchaeota archaeon]